MDETRVFGYCENCEDKITDEHESGEYFVNDDGEVFCCMDCVCEHYNITKIEI